MKIYIGSDHGGYELKHYLMKKFNDFEFKDLGHLENDSTDDYPEIAHQVAEAVSRDKDSLGVLICGSGLGMSMAANKHQGIRAASVNTSELAKLARQHNNANLLTLGGQIVSKSQAAKILKIFISTEFAGGRHQARVNNIDL